jgi:hypothetical protein
MAQADSKNTTPTAFLSAIARIHLSHLFQNPFLRVALKAAAGTPRPINQHCASPALLL